MKIRISHFHYKPTHRPFYYRVEILLWFLCFILGTYSTFVFSQENSAPPLMCGRDEGGKHFSLTRQNWYDEIVFKDPEFNFQFIRTLGYSFSQGADLGECFATACSIKEGDIQSWFSEWRATGDRLNHFAAMQKQSGNILSAREANFRASNYFRTASFFMASPEDRTKGNEAWSKSRESFEEAIESLPHVQSVVIPYGKTSLPGYFISANRPNAPLLIIHSGFDGTAEELYFNVGVAANARGYHVLLFEGPGQGAVIREQDIFFRYDWEKVVTPVVDFALRQPGIDKNKIALLGISMGGYLAPRACAYEKRIQACIANGGVYDLFEPINRRFPVELQALLSENPKKFDEIVREEMAKSITLKWFFNNGMWTFGVTSPSQLMVALKKYNLRGVAERIKQPILILDSEDDEMLGGQAKQLYDAIPGDKKQYYLFTSETAGQAHCQMGATAFSNEILFDWLDKQFNLSK